MKNERVVRVVEEWLYERSGINGRAILRGPFRPGAPITFNAALCELSNRRFPPRRTEPGQRVVVVFKPADAETEDVVQRVRAAMAPAVLAVILRDSEGCCTLDETLLLSPEEAEPAAMAAAVMIAIGRWDESPVIRVELGARTIQIEPLFDGEWIATVRSS